MAASKPTDRHTHTRAQCSPASVGLAQARPNYVVLMNLYMTTMPYENIYRMAGKFGGELNLADWRSDKRAAKLNSANFCPKYRIGAQASRHKTSISRHRRSQGECKLVSSGLDYGVTQVFSSSGTHEGPLPHRERTTRSKRWHKGSQERNESHPQRHGQWQVQRLYA